MLDAHQLAAWKVTRVGHSASSSAADESNDASKLGTSAEQETVRQQFIREFDDILRGLTDKGTGTGLDCNVRWKGSAPVVKTENHANAALASGQHAATVSHSPILPFDY